HRSQGGFVKDAIDALDRLGNFLRIGNVTLDELHVAAEQFDVPRIAGRKVVENAHAIAAGEQALGNMRTNKACTAGDQKRAHRNLIKRPKRIGSRIEVNSSSPPQVAP